MKEVTQQINQILSTHNLSSAYVEMGHFYVDHSYLPNQDTEMHSQGIDFGTYLVDDLKQHGIKVSTMVFIDDLHTTRYFNHQDIPTLVDNRLAEYKSRGFEPDITVYEKSLVDPAKKLMLVLLEKDAERKNKKKILQTVPESKVIFMKHFDSQGSFDRFHLLNGYGIPTCELLDAALYIEKNKMMSEGGICMTVLPVSYQNQQYRTKAILKQAGIAIPILDLYFDKEGTLSVDFDF